jgi:hypothetical protein
MIEKTKNSERRVLTATFFILLLAAMVLFAKASLTAFGIYSSATYSVVYFALFGACFVSTKYAYFQMFRFYQYVAMVMTTIIGGLCFLWLRYLH